MILLATMHEVIMGVAGSYMYVSMAVYINTILIYTYIATYRAQTTMITYHQYAVLFH